MPTATPLHLPHSPALRFVLAAGAWSLGLFGVMRLGWFETHALLPLTLAQARIAERIVGPPTMPIDVTLACSGADVLSLCAGAILAYPVRWRMRLAGAAGGMALVLALNTLRIGSLGSAADVSWFELLHVYVWPAVLTLAVALYVFTWFQFADRRNQAGDGSTPLHQVPSPDGRAPLCGMPQEHRAPQDVLRRFGIWAAALLIIFTVAGPLYMESAAVLSAATAVARMGAALLVLLGVSATVNANVLLTERGAFLVTQECIATPLIPVFLAAIIVGLHTWRRRALALVAAAPLFFALGVARLLVVALPAALVGSPAFAVHAFSQLLVGAMLVGMAALWRHGAGPTAGRRALLGGALGCVVVYLLGAPYARTISGVFAPGAPLNDPQGAVLLLPAFQAGLYVALSIAGFAAMKWNVFVGGLAVLGVLQVALFAALHLLASHADLAPHARDVRAWALAGPLLVVAAMVTYERSRR
ncbi:hypothetical protein BH23ACI1_BH23ACI1_08810 [soil metagenome]